MFWYRRDMIRSFRNSGTADIAKGVNSKTSRTILPVSLHRKARRKIAEIDFAASLQDLRYPGNRLHVLTADRAGQYSVSINDQYRICFRWVEGEVFNVEIVDYH